MMQHDRERRFCRVATLLLALVALPLLSPAAAEHEGGHPHGPPVSKPVEAAEPGWIWVPTGGPDRIFQPVSAHGVTLWYLDTISPGAVFSLQPQKQGVGVCTLGRCLQSDDFDILFYRESNGGLTSVTGRFESLGDESGVVPADAAFAFVFLKTPGVMPDGAKGFGFYYRQGTPGHDRLPEI